MRKSWLWMIGLLLLAGPAALAGDPEQANWYDRFDFGGDLRLRYEHFDWDEKLDDGKRDRFRYRLRFGFEAQVKDDLVVGVELRSGDPDNPHSDNQSFDGGFSKKQIALAEAYVGWQATPFLRVTGGKFAPKNLWTVSDMHWDDDVIAEGAMESFDWKRQGVLKSLALDLYQFVLDESGSSGDAYLFGGQVAPTFKLNDENELTVGVSYDRYTNPDRVVQLTFDGSLLTEPEGVVTNLVDPETGELVSEFEVGSLFAVWKNKASRRWPVTLSAFYYRNFGARSVAGSILESDGGEFTPVVSDLVSDENDTAFYSRLQVGDYKNPGQVAVRLIRYDSKPDAIFYAWVQSDTRRGSNVDGYRADLRVGMPRKGYVNVTWYRTDWKVGEDTTMNRLQADYIFAF